MEITAVLVWVVSAVFVAALVRSTFGFGDALVGMPLLVIMIDIRTATPLMAFVAILVSILLLVRTWRKVQFRAYWPLVISAVVGIPLGLLFLRESHEAVMKIVLAVLVLGFATWRLAKPESWKLDSDKPAVLFGFVSGVLGGAYNTSGPPVVIYGSLRRWEPEAFISTMQAFGLLTSVFIIAGHGIAGLWTRDVFRLFAYAAPGVVLAVVAGTFLRRAFPGGRYDRAVLILLFLIGAFLLGKTVHELV